MEEATGLRLPWRLLRDKLAPIHNDSSPLDVSYYRTFELLDQGVIVSCNQSEFIKIYFSLNPIWFV